MLKEIKEWKKGKMIQLIYVSSATRVLSEEDLVFLLEQARDRNKRQNVTGMLLHAGGNFFQVLEGDEKDVEEIYDSIVQDNRNKGNIVMKKDTINERNFPEWSMGFRHLTEEDKNTLKGYSEFLERKMESKEFVNKSDIIVELLYDFKTNNDI